MKSFIFLYPLDEIFNLEIKNGSYNYDKNKSFRDLYKKRLNECIDLRYRKNSFDIYYAIFDEHSISDIVNLKDNDKIINVGITFKEHTEKHKYPDEDFVINQINNPERLVVTGFHMWDCVEKIAKRAYERKINVLVDEDLTEFLSMNIKDKNFRTDIYPSINPRNKMSEGLFNEFLNARKNRPWLYQNY